MREARLARNVRLLGGRAHDVGEALVADERLRFGVLEDVGDLGRAQPVVDRHVVPARLERREVQVEGVRAVRQHRRDGVAALESETAERVHDLVRPRQHITGGVLGAVGIDDREIPGIFLRVRPKAHAAQSRTRSTFEPMPVGAVRAALASNACSIS